MGYPTYDFTFVSYQEQARRTMAKGMTKDFGPGYAMGLAGEAGEVVDYLKKVLFHDHPLDRVKLGKELGDVLWYVAALCEHYGISMEGVARQNIQKLQERYPGGFSFERSIHRKLGE